MSTYYELAQTPQVLFCVMYKLVPLVEGLHIIQSVGELGTEQIEHEESQTSHYLCRPVTNVDRLE